MAREHARIDVLIWDDPDFLALSESAQRLYFMLLSQEELTYAGLLPLRLRRWASRSSTSTVEGVTAALAELAASRFVVVDYDAEEVLVRSLIRRDGIYKQPNVLSAAMRQAFEITSPLLRSVLAAELDRLPVEVTGEGPGITAAALLAGLRTMPVAVQSAGDYRRKRTRTPAPTPASDAVDGPLVEGQAPAEQTDTTPDTGHDIATADVVTGPPASPSPNPSGNPSGNPSPNPSGNAQGEGGRGLGVVALPTKETTYVGGAPRAREHAPTREKTPAPAREQARRLVADEVPGQPSRVAGRLAGEAARLLGEGIAPEYVAAGLRLWSGKRLGTGMLPELVSEAMREPVIVEASRPQSRTDQAVMAALEMGRRFAIEDGDESEFGRMLRATAPGAALGPVPWSALLPAAASGWSAAAPMLVGAGA